MKINGFTLIELLVVVAIIGILAAVGIVAYSGYTTGAKKAVVKSNWKTTVKFMNSEFARCGLDSSNRVFGNPGVPCNDIMSGNNWSCIAINLSYDIKLSNPLDTERHSWYGKTYSKMSNCVVIRNNSPGVRAGDGEVDGAVSVVKCPRNPYCTGNDGKLKVMWWWDDKTMQDSSIVDPEF